MKPGNEKRYLDLPLQKLGHFRRAMALESQLGKDFQRLVHPDALREYEKRKKEWLEIVRGPIARALEDPVVRRMTAALEAADSGDPDAIMIAIELSPVAAMQRREIGSCIMWHQDDPDETSRAFLERVASAVRTGLLQPRPGRPRRVDRALALLADAVQRAYESAPAKLKKTYRNDRVRLRDIADIADHVSRLVPPKLRDQTNHAAVDVLKAHPGITKAFGVEVAAKLLCCSPRHIRSIRKSR